MKENSTVLAENKKTDPASAARLPQFWKIIIIGLVAIVFTAGWLYSYEYLNKIIWGNNYVAQNKWVIPAGAVFFSFIVGLALKYLHSPSVLKGGFVESLKSEEKLVDYRSFPGTLLSSYASLLSGVSVGPEGPLAFLVQEIAVWTREKLKINERTAFAWTMAALASAFNGIIGSPLFTTVFATEFQVTENAGLTFLIWNLLAGAIGYLFFALLKLTVFASSIPISPVSQIKPEYVGYAVLLGLIGTVMATFIGLAFQLWERLMGWVFKIFKDNVIIRIMTAGAITGMVCYFFPEVQFSGGQQILQIISNPVVYGTGLLVLLAFLKILLLGLAFKSGYLGGPIFPTLFAATMIALALSLAFPSVPISIFVTCIEVAMVTLVLGLPLAAIILVGAVNNFNTYTIGLLVVSGVTAMIAGGNLKRYLRRWSV
jgi:H+/Cl- antiporter ClcA